MKMGRFGLKQFLFLFFAQCFFNLISCKQNVKLGSSPLPNAEGTFGASRPNYQDSPIPAPSVNANSAPQEKAFQCCYFPLNIFPSSYPFNQGGERSFGSGREGGTRKHAAADLYHIVGEPIYAVDDGEVIDTYEFYSSTYAVEVQHPGFIIRYGEIKQKLPDGVSPGVKVKAGQIIAYIGQMKCCRPMLHFEMFSGEGKGPLSDLPRLPYKRRSDLLNPTSKLLEWQNRLPK